MGGDWAEAVSDRRDPTHLHHAAGRLGDLVASGEMSDEGASAAIVHMLPLAPPGLDPAGLQMRLHWTMRDRAQEARRAAENAATAVRWAVRPLFDRKASKAEIEEAAGKAAGEILTWPQVVAILRDELARAQKQRRG
jgi:hypothetical protein